ncbi:hypothetical protein D3C86_1994210 [compost metagenome]
MLGRQGPDQLGEVLGGADLGELRREVSVNGLEDGVLALEMVVQRAFLDADRPGQVPDRDGAVAVLREQGDGGLKDPLLGMNLACLRRTHRDPPSTSGDRASIN